MGQFPLKYLGLLAVLVVLPGCLSDITAQDAVARLKSVTPFGGTTRPVDGDGVPIVKKAAMAEAPETAEAAATDPAAGAAITDASPIIRDLQARQAILVEGTPYARVAAAVMASDARVAEAELRAARLREKAADRNWLPTIGPRISLNSLGEMVADLVINQVLFDNGRKVAERDYAKADVELAAVALSEDGNTRVYDALSLYLKAHEGRADARLAKAALKDMGQFEWVMTERVKGGVGNPSDLTVLRQKLAELRARAEAAAEMTATAMAELNAMSAVPLADLDGLGTLGSAPGAVPALSVLRAQAERDRAIAEARIERAAHLPGLSAGGSVGDSGDRTGLSVQTDKLFGFGTGASLKALETDKQTADRKVTEAREASERAIAADRRQLDALRRQAAEAERLTTQAKANLDLFQRQYDGGQRRVMDVVGVYETFVAQQKAALGLTMEAHRLELSMARRLGLLADGAGI